MHRVDWPFEIRQTLLKMQRRYVVLSMALGIVAGIAITILLMPSREPTTCTQPPTRKMVPHTYVNSTAAPCLRDWLTDPRPEQLMMRCPTAPSGPAIRNLIRSSPFNGFAHCLNQETYVIAATKTKPPFCVSLYSADVDPQRWSIKTHGVYYEVSITGFFDDVLARYTHTPRLWVVDAGANVGWFVGVAASRHFHALAIEASPVTVCRTAQTLAASAFDMRVKLIHGALADTSNRTVQFYIDPSNPGAARVVPWRETPVGTVVHVPTVALRDVVPPCVDVVLLKIDIEGAETGALRGAMPLFTRGQVHYMVVELRANSDTASVFSSLTTLGYRVAEVHGAACDPNHEGWSVADWQQYIDRAPAVTNWVWYRHDLEKPARLRK